MNKKMLLAGLALILGIGQLSALRVFGERNFVNEHRHDEHLSVMGECNVRNSSFRSVSANGSLTAQDLRVKETISVTGECDGKRIACHYFSGTGSTTIDNLIAVECSVTGELTLSNSLVNKGVTTTGEIRCSQTQAGHLSFTGKEAFFKDCTIQSIEVFPSKDHKSVWNFVSSFWSSNKDSDPQVLHLSGGTRISGDVKFHGGKGTVRLAGGAQVFGNVIGGVIQHCS